MTSRSDVVSKALSFNGYEDGFGYDCANEFSANLGRPTESWCFAAETLISTPEGLRIIAEIEVGDLVTSPAGVERCVEATANREADDVLKLQALGLEGTVTTASHPYWVRRRATGRERSYTRAEWVSAGDLQRGDLLAIPRPQPGTEPIDEHVAYVVGRWLADGWVTWQKSRSTGRLCPKWYICCAHDEADKLSKALLLAGVAGARKTYRTVEQFAIRLGPVTSILVDAGAYAHGKRVPGAVLGWNEIGRQAFLAGYLDGDGCSSSQAEIYARASSASRSLAYGIAEVARSLRYIASVYRYARNSTTDVIEGRTVQTRDRYEVHLRIARDRSQAFQEQKVDWVPVRGTTPMPPTTVFNLTVADDHTFIADGVAVHNCGDYYTDIFKRAGLTLPSMQPWCPTGFAYVPSAVDAAKAKSGAWVRSWQGQPGDAVIYDWNHDGLADHVEMLTSYSSPNLYTIGGNSGPSNVDHFVGQGGVHRHLWNAPTNTGNNLILGVISISHFVTFGPTVTPTTCPYRLLMLKSPLMHGADVESVQVALNTHGASPALRTDGYYGPLTEAAVVAFQKRVGLSVDGVVGCATRAKLGLPS